MIVIPTEDGKKERIGKVVYLFLLSSIVLCKATLLDDYNYEVFESTLCVLLLQVSKAFPKIRSLCLYDATVLCYAGKKMWS